MAWPWSDLGVEEGADLASVERAYAERLKTIHPEDDPVGFQALHGAYLMAGRYARQTAERAAPPPEPKPAGKGFLFQLEENPSFRFQAASYGTRDTEQGKRGYKTNYADALLYSALDGFSEEWGLPLYFGRALNEPVWKGAADAEFPPYYNLVIPTTGAEDALTALGETLDGLFTALDGQAQPQATLSIGRAGLEHYFYYDFTAREEALSTDALQMADAYNAQFASNYAEYAIKTSGAAEQDLGPDYVPLPMGPVEVKGEPYYRFDAAQSPESDTVQYQYFVSADGKCIKCVPIPWPESLVPQPGGGAPEAFGYFLTKDFISLPGGADISVDRYFDWSRL